MRFHFLGVFLVDSILTRRKINMGYIIFYHMKICSIRSKFVFPYGMFITKIMKFFRVSFHEETEIHMIKAFGIYNIACLHHM